MGLKIEKLVKKAVLFVLAGLFSLALLLVSPILYFIGRDYYLQFKYSGIIRVEKDKTLPNGIREEVFKSIKESGPYIAIKKRGLHEREKLALDNFSEEYAMNIQKTIDNFDDEDLIREMSERENHLMPCAAEMFGDDGIALVRKIIEDTESGGDRHYKSLIASRQFAFKTTTLDQVTKEECLREYGKKIE